MKKYIVSPGDRFLNSHGNLVKILNIDKYETVKVEHPSGIYSHELIQIERDLANGTYTGYVPVSPHVPFIQRKLDLAGLDSSTKDIITHLLYKLNYKAPNRSKPADLRNLLSNTKGIVIGYPDAKRSCRRLTSATSYTTKDIPAITIQELRELVKLNTNINKNDKHETISTTTESRDSNSRGSCIKKKSKTGRVASSSRLVGNRINYRKVGGKKAKSVIQGRNLSV
jgi:hypothetical protein